jgi:hypothetical protein
MHASTPERGSLESFRLLERLHDHWARPSAPRPYSWFLTFEDCPALAELARQCQEKISFPYYDLVAARDLHLTLGQAGIEKALTPGQLNDLRDAAQSACQRVAPLRFTIGALGGTTGAIGFAAYPREPVAALRTILRETSTATCPGTPGRWPQTQPHVSIAYANADMPASAAIAAVERLHSAHTEVTVRDVALVLVDGRQHAYTWQTIYRIPLAGSPPHHTSRDT